MALTELEVKKAQATDKQQQLRAGHQRKHRSQNYRDHWLQRQNDWTRIQKLGAHRAGRHGAPMGSAGSDATHALVNQTAAAYVRTAYFEERRGIMQQWADYLDKAEAGAEVIPLRA